MTMEPAEDTAPEPADATTATAPPAPTTKTRIHKVRAQTDASKTKNNSSQTSSLVQDDKLKALLEGAEDIQSAEHFTHWKDSFLDAFQEYLNPDGVASAREADDTLFVHMETLAKVCVKVQSLTQTQTTNGSTGTGIIAISSSNITVKGQNALNEWTAEMAKLEQEIKRYLPKSQKEEEIAGYTKMELGAILIRDSFRVYDIMITTRDLIVRLRDGPLKHDGILKPNTINILNFYLSGIDSFCDTIADLGLYKLMNKCQELYKIRPRKKKSKKIFQRAPVLGEDGEPLLNQPNPLSDSSDSDNPTGGRTFRRQRIGNFKSIMDKGWSSGVTGKEVLDTLNKEGLAKKKRAKNPSSSMGGTRNQPVGGTDSEDSFFETVDDESEEEEEEEEEDTEFIYYYDPSTGNIGKISRRLCLKEKIPIRLDEESGKEVPEGDVIKEWEEKEKFILEMKDAARGKWKPPVKVPPVKEPPVNAPPVKV
jgi:hypothetical protein